MSSSSSSNNISVDKTSSPHHYFHYSTFKQEDVDSCITVSDGKGQTLTATSNVPSQCKTVVASSGFSDTDSAIHLFAFTRTDNESRGIASGFTFCDAESFRKESGRYAYYHKNSGAGSYHLPGDQIPGISLDINNLRFSSKASGGWTPYPIPDRKNGASASPCEVINILRITAHKDYRHQNQKGSNNSNNNSSPLPKKYEIQWIVNGKAGEFVDCTKQFTSSSSSSSLQIFPAITLTNPKQTVRILSLSELKDYRPEKSYIRFITDDQRKFGDEKLCPFFEKHAPYNLKRIDLILFNMKISQEDYMKQLYEMYDV